MFDIGDLVKHNTWGNDGIVLDVMPLADDRFFYNVHWAEGFLGIDAEAQDALVPPKYLVLVAKGKI
jgi:heat shock protein HspQ